MLNFVCRSFGASGGTGIRTGLKILGPQGIEGSIPSSPTCESVACNFGMRESAQTESPKPEWITKLFAEVEFQDVLIQKNMAANQYERMGDGLRSGDFFQEEVITEARTIAEELVKVCSTPEAMRKRVQVMYRQHLVDKIESLAGSVKRAACSFLLERLR